MPPSAATSQQPATGVGTGVALASLEATESAKALTAFTVKQEAGGGAIRQPRRRVGDLRVGHGVDRGRRLPTRAGALVDVVPGGGAATIGTWSGPGQEYLTIPGGGREPPRSASHGGSHVDGGGRGRDEPGGRGTQGIATPRLVDRAGEAGKGGKADKGGNARDGIDRTATRGRGPGRTCRRRDRDRDRDRDRARARARDGGVSHHRSRITVDRHLDSGARTSGHARRWLRRHGQLGRDGGELGLGGLGHRCCPPTPSRCPPPSPPPSCSCLPINRPHTCWKRSSPLDKPRGPSTAPDGRRSGGAPGWHPVHPAKGSVPDPGGRVVVVVDGTTPEMAVMRSTAIFSSARVLWQSTTAFATNVAFPPAPL